MAKRLTVLDLTGLAVPWDMEIEHDGTRESFAPGSIDPAQAVGQPVHWNHDWQQIGKITAARDTPEGLEITARVLPVGIGRDVIEWVYAGELNGLSISFSATRTERASGVLRYLKAELRGVSIVHVGAYPPALIKMAG